MIDAVTAQGQEQVCSPRCLLGLPGQVLTLDAAPTEDGTAYKSATTNKNQEQGPLLH